MNDVTGSTAPTWDQTQLDWSVAFFDELAALGLRQVIVSPGSRSTPWVLAATNNDNLDVQLVLDERSAGFVALGQAKVSGRPSLLLCTSGSAVGHYLPALLEASYAHLPLLILSADRPPDLQGNAAPQTMDQLHLFGGHVRSFFELGLARDDTAALSGLRRKAAQAWSLSTDPQPGPVHINAAARKPLSPAGAWTTDASRSAPSQRARLGALPRPRRIAPKQTLDAILDLMRQARRPMLAVGPLAPWQAPSRELLCGVSDATGWPIYAEPGSNCRFGVQGGLHWDAADLCLRAKRSADSPDFVLQLGPAPTSGAWHAQTAGAIRVVVAGGWPDPHNDAALVVDADLDDVLSRLNTSLPQDVAAWQRQVMRANTLAHDLVDAHLTRSDQLDELRAMHVVGQTLTRNDLLCLGNSLTIRVADTVLRASSVAATCSTQRGLNGIDGSLSSALGSAQLHAQADSRRHSSGTSERHTCLITGDLSFLHDVGALQLLSVNNDVPLSIVVLNNRGGRLFEQLPIAQTKVDLRPWTTPHDHSIARIVEGFGVPNWTVSTCAELKDALAQTRALQRPGVIEVLCDPLAAARTYQDLSSQLSKTLSSGV